MAHIFKAPAEDQKGILMFTHKEVNHFLGALLPPLALLVLERPLLAPFRLADLLIARRRFRTRLERWKEHFHLGIHVGWNIRFPAAFGQFDFVMAPKAVIELNPDFDRTLLIPMNSGNFVPASFVAEDPPTKHWDLLCVSHNRRYKNLQLFLRSIRKLYDLGYPYRVLLISKDAGAEKRRPKQFYAEIFDDYYRMFSQDERDRFLLLRPSRDSGFGAIPYGHMAYLYRSSKVFTLFSQEEGATKVIPEALMCGLPVVIKKDLRGGGLDFVDERCAVFFDTYESAHEAMIEAVERWTGLEVDREPVAEQVSSERSLKRLKEYFARLYKEDGQTFDDTLINTDNLNIRLPAHMTIGLPWVSDRLPTADLRTRWELDRFSEVVDSLRAE